MYSTQALTGRSMDWICSTSCPPSGRRETAAQLAGSGGTLGRNAGFGRGITTDPSSKNLQHSLSPTCAWSTPILVMAKRNALRRESLFKSASGSKRGCWSERRTMTKSQSQSEPFWERVEKGPAFLSQQVPIESGAPMPFLPREMKSLKTTACGAKDEPASKKHQPHLSTWTL